MLLIHVVTESQTFAVVAQMVKRLPTMRENRVQSLAQEDLLEKGMATYSSILAPRKKGGLNVYHGNQHMLQIRVSSPKEQSQAHPFPNLACI